MITQEDTKINIKDFLAKKSPVVDKEMEKFIPRKATKEWLENALGKTIFELDLEAYSAGCNVPIWDLLDRGGKRFRPILTAIVSEAVGGKWDDGIKVSPIVELIHNGCVEENSLVWMADGSPKKMRDVQVGDYVLSVDKFGQLKERRVSFKHNNGVKKVLKIKSNNRTLLTTEEHPFLVVEKEQPFHYKVNKKLAELIKEKVSLENKTVFSFLENAFKKSDFGGVNKRAVFNALRGYKNCFLPEEFVDYLVETLNLSWSDFEKKQCLFQKANVSFKWKRAKNLVEGEILVVGKNVYSKQGIIPQMPIFKKNNKDRYNIPIVMSKDFVKLCGFIVGDGHIAKDKVELCIPVGIEGRKEYEELVEKLFLAEPSKYNQRITLCSTALVKLFKSLGLSENHLKIKIPDWVFKLPIDYKLAFVKGYFDSDGSISKRGDIRFECANKFLIEQFKMLLDSSGFITGNVGERTVSNAHFKNAIKKESQLYSLSINATQSIALVKQTVVANKFGSKMVSLRQEEKVPSLPQNLSFDQLGFVEVSQIIDCEPAQTFDIEVDETHSYIANGIVVHNTLMQDDVEDDSQSRRGKPCTHKLFGIDTAVNTGTIMYYWPLIKIMNNNFDLNSEKKLLIYDLYIKEMLRVCSGQVWDIAWHNGGFTPNEAQYLNMCLSKTGVLTKFACQLGAIMGDANEKQLIALGNFGQIIGVGFQIQDDILELTEDSFKEKKGSVGGDIHEGKRTLIIIRTLEVATNEDKKRLIEILDSHTHNESEIKEAIKIINKYDGIDYSRKKANEMVTKAWEEVDSVIEESNAKKILKKFAEYLVDRKI